MDEQALQQEILALKAEVYDVRKDAMEQTNQLQSMLFGIASKLGIDTSNGLDMKQVAEKIDELQEE